jgi:hypothetical protein
VSRIRAQIAEIVGDERLTGLLDTLVSHEYEFACPAFVYAGPGHQSKHTCHYHMPHSLDGEHADSMYWWEGTATYYPDSKRLMYNPRHYGGHCC